jgi:hypothetical protein
MASRLRDVGASSVWTQLAPPLLEGFRSAPRRSSAIANTTDGRSGERSRIVNVIEESILRMPTRATADLEPAISEQHLRAALNQCHAASRWYSWIKRRDDQDDSRRRGSRAPSRRRRAAEASLVDRVVCLAERAEHPPRPTTSTKRGTHLGLTLFAGGQPVAPNARFRLASAVLTGSQMQAGGGGPRRVPVVREVSERASCSITRRASRAEAPLGDG